MSTVTRIGRVWDAVLVTVTALAASRVNRASKICTVTRVGRLFWDAILVTDDGFGALLCKKCAQSHESGGWGDTIGWRGGRRTENRDHIQAQHKCDVVNASSWRPGPVFRVWAFDQEVCLGEDQVWIWLLYTSFRSL